MEKPEVLGQEIQRLINSNEWKAATKVIEACLDKWRNNLLHFAAGASIEDIAKERMRWVFMRSGVEELLRSFNDCVTAFEAIENKREEVIHKNKHENPYRVGE